MRRLLVFVLLAGCGAALLAELSAGAATPVSPPPGATLTTSHPVFSWTVPPNEESDGIYVARNPATTPEGRFFEENVADLDVFFAGETSWSPTTPLPASQYWWLVWTHDRDTFDSFYSAPISFRIAASAGISSVRVRRYVFLDSLDISVRWTSNTENATVTARLRRAGRLIWRDRSIEEFVSIGSPNLTTFYWNAPRRLRQGTRLQLEVTVLADGATARLSRGVRSP